MSISLPDSLKDFVDEQVNDRLVTLWLFYVERSDHIDVWRVLHGMLDIPSWMQDPDLT
jgi:plasmid stabilization system protein ParE